MTVVKDSMVFFVEGFPYQTKKLSNYFSFSDALMPTVERCGTSLAPLKTQSINKESFYLVTVVSPNVLC